MNPMSKIIKIMQEEGQKLNPEDTILGEVVENPPNLRIKVNEIILYKENLVVDEYLTAGHKREVSMQGTISLSGDDCGEIQIEIPIPKLIKKLLAKLKFEIKGTMETSDTIKTGDTVMLKRVGEKYIVLGKMVEI